MKKRPAVAKAPEPRRRRRAARGAGISRPLRPKPRWWGDVFGLELGVGGGLQISDFQRLQGGVLLSAGFKVLRWTLRAELALHDFFLLAQRRTIFLLRPAFWVGWRVPLGRIERWLQLRLLAGAGTELFVLEQKQSYALELAWGILAGLQLHWRFARRWSLFARPSFVLLPGGINPPQTPHPLSTRPATQLALQLGVEVSL